MYFKNCFISHFLSRGIFMLGEGVGILALFGSQIKLMTKTVRPAEWLIASAQIEFFFTRPRMVNMNFYGCPLLVALVLSFLKNKLKFKLEIFVGFWTFTANLFFSLSAFFHSQPLFPRFYIFSKKEKAWK